MKNMKFSMRYVLCLLLIAAISVTSACGVNVTIRPIESKAEAQVTEIGEGETAFEFDVVDQDGNVTVFNVKTDETTVGAALLNCELVAGDVSEYGLYVTYVNGIRADWNEDGAYWAFYINGEYAMTGVDATDIEADAVYSFVYTLAE